MEESVQVETVDEINLESDVRAGLDLDEPRVLGGHVDDAHVVDACPDGRERLVEDSYFLQAPCPEETGYGALVGGDGLREARVVGAGGGFERASDDRESIETDAVSEYALAVFIVAEFGIAADGDLGLVGAPLGEWNRRIAVERVRLVLSDVVQEVVHPDELFFLGIVRVHGECGDGVAEVVSDDEKPYAAADC